MSADSPTGPRKATDPFPRGAGAPGPASQVNYRPRQAADYGSDKAVVQALYGQLGVKRAQAILGLGKSEAYLLGAVDKPGEVISYPQIRQLSAAGATAAAEDLACLCGGAFLPLPRGPGALAGLTAEMLRQHGETAAVLMTAMLDGQIDRAEARAGLASVHELLQEVAAVYAGLLQVAAPEMAVPDPEERG